MAAMRLALLVSLLGSIACTSMRTVRDPARFIAQASPDRVYVTHNNGALLTIRHPRVSGDSLHGTWEAAAQPLALPLNHVRRVTAFQRDKTRTTLAIAGVSAVTLAMTFLLTRDVSKVQQPCNADGATQFNGCDNPR